MEFDLELPDVEVLRSFRGNKGDYIIEFRSTKKSGICRKCGKEIRHMADIDPLAAWGDMAEKSF